MGRVLERVGCGGEGVVCGGLESARGGWVEG